MEAQLPPPLVLTYIYLFRMIAVRNLKNSSNDEATYLFDRNKAKLKCPYEFDKIYPKSVESQKCLLY